MTSFRLARVPALIVLAGSAWLAGCGPSIPASVKIGVAQPLSGPSAARGQDLLNGVQLAVKELNAAGYQIGGKPVTIEVIAVDDKADAETAKKVAQQLIDQKVLAVIGHLNSDITEATIPIYRQADVPQMFTSSAAELTKQAQGNGFRLVANDALQAQAIASYVATTLKARRIAIIHETTAFGTPMSKDVSAGLAKHGASVALSEGVDRQATDFSGFVGKLKATPPDAVVAVLRDNQLLPLFAQMKAAQLSDVPVMATSVAKTSTVLNGPPDVKLVYLTSSALTPREFYAGPAFVTRFRAAYKDDPVWAAHYAYDAVHVLAEAIRTADGVNGKALRARLHAIDAAAPVTSTMRFTAEGESPHGAISIYQRKDGRWDALMRSEKW